MAEQLPPICPPCTAERMKWLDSKPSQVLPSLGFAHGSGAAYDTTSAGLRNKGRSRYERWRLLVNEQMARIAEHCRAAGHSTTPATPRVVDVELFGLAAGPNGGGQ